MTEDNADLKKESPPTTTQTAATTIKTTTSPPPLHNIPSPCHCDIYDKLLKESLLIKEATTGYLDPVSGQDIGNFVTYVIEFGETKTRKRYSDFELLAAHLNRVYTFQVIPPIPEKETLTSIISGYTGFKGRHDPFLIQHRIRLFQSFLINLQSHPVLRCDHYFHRLLDSSLSGSAWSEGITSVITEGNVSSVNDTAGKSKVPDPLVVRLEEMTQKYREGIKSIERGQCKLLKRLKEESNVLSELGASFNAFSLELNDHQNLTNQNQFPGERTNPLSFPDQLEKIGQSSDSEVIHLHSLIRHHELLRDRLQEIILYCGSVQKSLHRLTQKRASLEEFHDEINAKKNILMQMESNVRADSEGDDENLQKLKKNISELENLKKIKLSEMSEYSNLLLKDIDRTFSYFGHTWKESLRALAECQSEWHEEAIKSNKF